MLYGSVDRELMRAGVNQSTVIIHTDKLIIHTDKEWPCSFDQETDWLGNRP